MTKHSVCCTPHLRNYTLHDCHLWCKCVKWWYLQVFFSILKFWFSVLSGCWKGKKWPKMTKFFVCYTLYFRNHISDKKIISPGIFFILFSKFRSSGYLGVWGVVKEQKIAQNDKKFCLSHFVSQEPYIIWLWVLVHMCKMIISRANFFIFQTFDFKVFRGIKRAKNDMKLPIPVCFTLYLRNCRSYHQEFDDLQMFFFIFFKKMQDVNIKIILFFIGLLQQFC